MVLQGVVTPNGKKHTFLHKKHILQELISGYFIVNFTNLKNADVLLSRIVLIRQALFTSSDGSN